MTPQEYIFTVFALTGIIIVAIVYKHDEIANKTLEVLGKAISGFSTLTGSIVNRLSLHGKKKPQEQPLVKEPPDKA